MHYLYRTLERTSPNQREYCTYAKRRIEGSMRVQAVVSNCNPFQCSEKRENTRHEGITHPNDASCQSTTVTMRIALGTVAGG